MLNLMFKYLDGMFFLGGQQGSVLFLLCRQCLLSEGRETQILFVLIPTFFFFFLNCVWFCLPFN